MSPNQLFKQPLIVMFILSIVLISIAVFITKPTNVGVLSHNHIESTKQSETLVVLLHAYTANGESLDEVKHVIKSHSEFEDAHIYAPDLPFGLLSMANPINVSNDLMNKIDELWQANNYQKIVFVGHSMGALFARKLYVLATGEQAGARFLAKYHQLAKQQGKSYRKPRMWVKSVDRIILLAGMNNGWTLSHHMGIERFIMMKFGTAFGHILEWVHDQEPIIFHIRNGSGFITQLKLQWLAMRGLSKGDYEGGAHIVQLLGTVDDLVPPTDNVDVVTGADFSYIEVPHTGHSNIKEMSFSSESKSQETSIKNVRAEKFFEALTKQDRQLEEAFEPQEVNDVVFVIHGIRDLGYWTEKIASRVKSEGKAAGRKVETIYSSYGYFPMLGFLRPGARDDKVQWFMNNYTVAKAKYENAKFHFVGHSHGTYLLASALEKYDSVAFENVLFAGSVVRSDFCWQCIQEDRRVNKVQNLTATADWVVGIFPNALEKLDLQDLGGAGHNGFKAAASFPAIVNNKGYYVGGHSAGIQEDVWPDIARFIIHGIEIPNVNVLESGKHITQNEQALWVVTLSYIAPIVWLLILSVLLLGFYRLFMLRTREWKKTVYIISYSLVIWTILTRI